MYEDVHLSLGFGSTPFLVSLFTLFAGFFLTLHPTYLYAFFLAFLSRAFAFLARVV